MTSATRGIEIRIGRGAQMLFERRVVRGGEMPGGVVGGGAGVEEDDGLGQLRQVGRGD